MSDILEKAKSFYSLDLLASLDPRDNHDMAEIILGTYIVNARAKSQIEDFSSRLRFENGVSRRSWASLVDSLERVDNLHTITDLIGRRAIQAIDISDGAEPIRHRGFHTVDEARGVIGKNEYGNRMISTPDHSSGQMRLALPGGRLLHRGEDWFAARIVDADNFEPLVELNVADSLRSFR